MHFSPDAHCLTRYRVSIALLLGSVLAGGCEGTLDAGRDRTLAVPEPSGTSVPDAAVPSGPVTPAPSPALSTPMDAGVGSGPSSTPTPPPPDAAIDVPTLPSAPATADADASVAEAGAPPVDGQCMPPSMGFSCESLIPRDPVLIDLSTYGDAVWGAADDDVTGGLGVYQGPDVEPPSVTLERPDADPVLRVTGSIPTGNFAGIVLWFNPCVDASVVLAGDAASGSPSAGLATALGGSLDGATLKLLLRTHENYPVDPSNGQGACLFTNCDTRYSECVSPGREFVSDELPPTLAALPLPWAEFTSGVPADSTNGEGLLGVQLQFECVAGNTCDVDVTLGSVEVMLE